MNRIEFDHLFICTSMGAPEADRLVEFGLSEGTSNSHPGQGTANRRFFFRNAMLELLWVYSPEEAQSKVIRPTYLWERWAGRRDRACPFGLGFRPAGNSVNELPFQTWDYSPPYLPHHLSYAMGCNVDILTEPLLFYFSFGQRPDILGTQPLDHPVGLREITGVTFISPHLDNASPTLQAAMQTNRVQMKAGQDYRIEISFDGELQGQQIDFAPALPLVFYW